MDVGSLRDIINALKELRSTEPFIDESILAQLVLQILEGLEYLHAKIHKVHRDIKPENILMNSLGEVKLTDFGVSKELEKTADICKTFIGTLIYMSPERLQGLTYSYTSDIWSLGLIIIELCTGKYPFGAQRTYIELIQNMIMSPDPTLPDNGLYSAELRDFVTKCLSKDQFKRCTASDLLEHPWIIRHKENPPNLSLWISKVLFNALTKVKSNVEERLRGNKMDVE